MSRRIRVVLAILNALFFILTILVNGLAISLPLNGKDTRELSELYPNLFVPAGLTFSIWSIIYLLLFAFIIYQLLEALRIDRAKAFFVDQIYVWFIVSCSANAAWVVAWHYEYVLLSVFIMLLLLFSLLSIYTRLNIGLGQVNRLTTYFVHLPFSIYLGWISVATVASVTTFLVDLEWTGFGLSEQFWAVAMLVIVVGLGLAMQVRRSDPFYSGVLIWAFIGIIIKRMAEEANDQAVLIAAISGAVILAVGMVYHILKKRVY